MANLAIALFIFITGLTNEGNTTPHCADVRYDAAVMEVEQGVELIVWEDCSVEVVD